MGEPLSEVRERESVAGVLGVGHGLLILLVLVLAVVSFRGGEADPAEVLGTVSTLGGPPAGLVVDRSVQLPGGDRMLRMDVEDLAALGVDGVGPREVLLAAYRSRSSVKALFRAGSKPQTEKRRKWEAAPTFAFREGLGGGELEWGDLRAPYARDRDYRAGGAWADTVRVNLSRPGANAVLFATWPDGVLADAQQMAPILRALSLKPLQG